MRGGAILKKALPAEQGQPSIILGYEYSPSNHNVLSRIFLEPAVLPTAGMCEPQMVRARFNDGTIAFENISTARQMAFSRLECLLRPLWLNTSNKAQ